MNSQQQISRTSHQYRLILTMILWLTPLLHAAIWFYFDHFPQNWALKQSLEIEGGLTPLMRILAFSASMLKGGVMMYGVWILIRLFRLYEKGIFFKTENVACFKKLSRTLLWWVLAGLIVTPLTSLILTMNNSPGNHALQISLQSADVTALVIGGVLRVIAGVMEDGRRLKDEMELVV
jgi:hypothetical protein